MNSTRQHYLEGFLAGAGKAGAVPTPAPFVPRPSSWEEQTKRELPPFDAFARLSECARADEPPSAADRFRFEWFGLFHHGPEKDAFTARVRLPGGRLPGFRCLGLARIVQELAGGWVEFNAQGGLDIPGVPVHAGVELLRRLDEIGLSTRGTGGDCVRAVRGGEQTDVSLVRELEHALAQDRGFGDLPGPCEVAFRCPHEGTAEGEHASLVFRALPPVAAGPGEPMFPPPLVSDPEMWKIIAPGSGDLGVMVAAAETVPVCLALLRVWSRQANRETRDGATLANFCRQLGSAGLRHAVEKEIGRRLAACLLPDVSAASDFSQGGIEVPGGRLLSGQLDAVARAAARCGVAEVSVVAHKYLLTPSGGTETAAFEAELRRILSDERNV